jgi:hypothetical protein
MNDIPREQLERLWHDYGCGVCVHFRPKTTSCAAFPDGIPIEVASGQVSHLDPLEGDRGIQFEPKAEFLVAHKG